jgi:hypothetical protein
MKREREKVSRIGGEERERELSWVGGGLVQREKMNGFGN